MEITVASRALREAVDRVAWAAPEPASCVGGQCISLSAPGDDLHIEATAPCGLRATTVVSANVVTTGSVTVEATRALVASVKALPLGAEVTIRTHGDELRVVTDGVVRAAIPVVHGRSLPIHSLGDHILTATMPGATLVRVHQALHHAVANERTRSFLNGTYWHVSDGQLTVAATDGHRMAVITPTGAAVEPAGAVGTPEGAILPREHLPYLAKTFGRAPSVTAVVYTAGTFWFGPGGTATTPVVADTYPDYARVIPDRFVSTVTYGRLSLLQEIKRLKFPVPRKEAQALAWNMGSGKVESCHPGYGAVAGSCPPLGWAGAPLPERLGVNRRYLEGCLTAFAGSQVCIHVPEGVQRGYNPLLLTDPDDPSYSQVLMPVEV